MTTHWKTFIVATSFNSECLLFLRLSEEPRKTVKVSPSNVLPYTVHDYDYNILTGS